MISNRISLIIITLTILMIVPSITKVLGHGSINTINVKAIPLSIYDVFTSKISYNFATINWKTNGLA